MISASQEFREAIVADTRRTLIKVVVDITDPDIHYSDPTYSSMTPYSKPEQLHDKIFEMSDQRTTLEQNRWILNRRSRFNVEPDDQMAFEGNDLCNQEGIFETPVFLDYHFENVDILQGFSIYFSDRIEDGFPVDYKVELFAEGTAFFTQEVKDNTELSAKFENFIVYNPTSIKITCSKWSLPYRRMRIVDFVIGFYEIWSGDMISSLSIKHQGDPSNTSLPYGTCSMVIDNHSRRFEPRRKNNLFQSIEERQSIDVQLGLQMKDKTEFKSTGLFYQYSEGWTTSDNGITMTWDLVDIIGLLSSRTYILPKELPTTLDGWIKSIMLQLGENFGERYTIEEGYGDFELTTTPDEIQSATCGDMILNVCMASGTWAHADAMTGNLSVEAVKYEGNKLTLDNMEAYPTMQANKDVAFIQFTLHDEANSQLIISGNVLASDVTQTVNNPFIKTEAQAFTAARMILSNFGGNALSITGRGDFSSEVGDMDTVWIDESSAVAARRTEQTFEMSDGVLRGCKTTLIQASGALITKNRAIFTSNGSWTAPAGVSVISIVLVGHGGDGSNGDSGGWDEAGWDGTNGKGGKVYTRTMNITEQQKFSVAIGDNVTFGSYSSADGKVYDYGYTDANTGDTYGRTGVQNPITGTGDGGAGGKGGTAGKKHDVKVGVDEWGWPITKTVIDVRPGKGTPGVKGVSGCAIVYWDKPDEEIREKGGV